MWLYRKTWRRIGIYCFILGITMIVGELFYQSWFNGTPYLTETRIDDCKLGRTTPEELGYPGLTCDELKVTEDSWTYEVCLSVYVVGVIAFVSSIFAKEEISVEFLNRHSEFVDDELVDKIRKLEDVNQELSSQERQLSKNQTQILLIENERKNLSETLEILQLQHSKESVDHASEIEKITALLAQNKAAAELAKQEYSEAENALNLLKKHGFEQTTIIQNTNVSDSVIMGDFNIGSSEK